MLFLSACLLFFGTVLSCNKYAHPQHSLTHIKPCLPLKLFFFIIPHFFIFHLFTNSALSFEFQTGRISEGGFHNVLSLFRQTAGQQGSNEILKGPFSFSFFILSPLPPSLSVKTATSVERVQTNIWPTMEKEKIWMQIMLYLLSNYSFSPSVYVF